jgi:hypothetical protein
MSTRSGGVLLYLMDRHGMGAREIEDLIYRRCGLLGASGISADMRTLRASTAPAAAEAIALFVYRVIREIGSMAAGLGVVLVSFRLPPLAKTGEQRRRMFRQKFPGTHTRGWPGYRRCHRECRCPGRRNGSQ